MATSPFGLDDLRVASPCSVSWSSMTGDERVRFCCQCRQKVYSLSDLTRDQAEALIREKNGALCVRFYQRADGTVMTADCPQSAFPTLLRRLAVAFGLLCALVVGLWLCNGGYDDERGHRVGFHLRSYEPFRTIFEWFDPAPPVVVMGDMIAPPPLPPVPPAPGPN